STAENTCSVKGRRSLDGRPAIAKIRRIGVRVNFSTLRTRLRCVSEHWVTPWHGPGEIFWGSAAVTAIGSTQRWPIMRARMVRHPGQYKSSSYRGLFRKNWGQSEFFSLVTTTSIVASAPMRKHADKNIAGLFRAMMAEESLDAARAATNGR